MTAYRRQYVPGGTYFFTVVTHQRRRLFDDPANVQVLRSVLRRVRQERPFRVLAAVVLPDHLHMLWQLPEGDADYAGRWRSIKYRFSLRCPHRVPGSALRRNRREAGLWQRRFWEHCIRDQEDLNGHLDYIHYNPVQHGLCTLPEDWPYSSLRRFQAQGVYPLGWGAPTPASIARLNLE